MNDTQYLDLQGLAHYTEKLNEKFISKNSTVQGISDATEAWLDEHVAGSNTTIVLDKSLTIDGAAADAKAVGAFVKVSDSQPTEQSNRLWINSGDVEEIVVPTIEDHNALKANIDGLNSAYNSVFDIQKVSTKNLNITPYPDTDTVGGVTFTRNDDGSVSMSGTPTNTIFWPTDSPPADDKWLLPAGTYTISGGQYASNTDYIAVEIELYENRTDTAKATGYYSGITISAADPHTFTTTKDLWAYVEICPRNGASTNGVTIYPQVEAGEAATSYVSPTAYASSALQGLENGVVRHDGNQSLTETQKSTARTNIGATSMSDVNTLKSALVAFLNQLILLIPDLAYSSPSHHGAATITAANAAIAAMSTTAPSLYDITKSLSHCSLSNAAVTVDSGDSYSATITAASGYILDTVTILMGNTDITSSVYNSSTGTIYIASVSGNLSIVASASEIAVALLSISASYNSGDAIIRTSNALNDLKNYLTVTAFYDDSSSSVLSAGDYTLSGTLALASGEYDVSAQTITVSYEGKTATFSVAVYNDITQSKVSLPSGYTQIAMIESTGSNCYIDTGILGSAVDHVEYGVQAMSGIGNGTNWHVLSGSRVWYPYFRQGKSGARNFQGKNETTSGSATSIDTTWEANTNYIIQAYPTVVINGTTITTIASAGSADNVNLCVFARNGGSNILDYGKIRMFYIKMYDSQDQLTHYFIPCKNSSDVAGLYDTVGDAFFPSSGSAALVAGGEVA